MENTHPLYSLRKCLIDTSKERWLFLIRHPKYGMILIRAMSSPVEFGRDISMLIAIDNEDYVSQRLLITEMVYMDRYYTIDVLVHILDSVWQKLNRPGSTR